MRIKYIEGEIENLIGKKSLEKNEMSDIICRNKLVFVLRIIVTFTFSFAE